MGDVPRDDRSAPAADASSSMAVARHPARREARFEELFRAHYRSVEAFVRGQFPGADVADVLSTTFATAWRRLDDIRVQSERGWLIGVANNTALNSVRGRRRRSARDEAYRTITSRGTTELHDHDVAPETFELLKSAFEQLSVTDREIIQLAAFDGLTGADLGAALGISSGAAAVRLHRARERFSEHYRKQEQP